ncbi:MAG: ATP-grasp domain-containing protein [Acidobacteria bacterium]|nr:ATP-grasp domain-containing protein [Acidobacteriota bacterium]
MPRLLLLSTTTGYQARAFRDAAARIGVPLALASDRCHVLEDPWQDGAFPVRFERPQESARKIVEYARESPLAGLVAIGDPPTLTAALASQELSLPFHPPEAVEACRNKFLARERYRAAGLPVPWYTRVAARQDPRPILDSVPFPCVLKPLGLSASRGVIRADNPSEFLAAFARISALLESPDVRRMKEESSAWIQVESYIPGCEGALEGILTRGRLRVLALFDKPDPLEGPYFEETIYVTPSRLDAATQCTIALTTERAIAAVGLWHGPLHAELRLNPEGIWMLDMAARPIGGLCAQALRFGDGMPLEELILRHALGEPVEDLPREQAASGVMMIPTPRAGFLEGVEGMDEAARTPGIDGIEITAKLRQKLVPLPEGSSYLGFIFARGETPEFVEHALREAHARLHFQVSPLIPVV